MLFAGHVARPAEFFVVVPMTCSNLRENGAALDLLTVVLADGVDMGVRTIAGLLTRLRKL